MSAFARTSHQDTLAKNDADLRDLETVDSLLPSSTYPILTLPTEIVIEIFVQYLPAYPSCPPLLGDGSPTRLAQICGHWRSIALDTPALWRAIQLSFDRNVNKEAALLSVVTAKIWLGRSRSLPLSIVYRCSPNNEEYLPQAYAAAALLDHCSRWQYATWHVSARPDSESDATVPVRREMPTLVDLHIHSHSMSAEANLSCINAPALRKVAGRLRDDTFYFRLFSEETWSNLTTLKLSDVPPYIAMSILKDTTCLVHCWLHFYDDDPIEPCPELSLPHLETLILDASWSSSRRANKLLNALAIPSLQRIAIREGFLLAMSDDPTQSLLRILRTSTAPLERLCILSPNNGREERYRAALPTISRFDFPAVPEGYAWVPTDEAWTAPWTRWIWNAEQWDE
ncbi:hypothetical protein C8F01DRAFT_1098276 [Mycena amicta]|nr:hypothetical protein C8F01DRAFT_1098276 [Mycena amicta]